MNLDVDGLDLIICVALVGGFYTGNWSPFIFFTLVAVFTSRFIK